ncbi:hypothetical protein Peur_002560 [Populus x canadensis]
MGKSLLNRLILRCITMYFNPTRLWIGLFGFFVLEKRDPLCGVVEPSEKLQSIVPRVCWPRSLKKAGKKAISGKLDGNMVQKVIRISGRSSVCGLGGLVSIFEIKFLVPFICSTVKVYLENHSANLRSWG